MNGNSSPYRDSPVSLVKTSETSHRSTISAANDSKLLTLHVIIESIPLSPTRIGTDMEFRGRIEADNFAHIPSQARFSDMLQIVLAKAGYLDDLPLARGYLQIRNWKPVPVEQIPESDSKSVSEVLSEIVSISTLYVRLFSSPKMRCARDIKDRLLRLLITQSQQIMASAGCPLDEGHLFSLIRGSGDISEETAKRFESWWALQVAHASRPHLPQPHTIPPPTHLGVQNNSTILDKIGVDPLHPALQQTLSPSFPSQKTRMRTSFDPECELPRLQRWFIDNQHPTRLQIQHYVAELNALESRRGRKPLDVNNVVYWFKNARAAHKRQEFRSVNGLKTPPSDDISVSDVDDSDMFAHQLTSNSDLHQSPSHHLSPTRSEAFRDRCSSPDDHPVRVKDESPRSCQLFKNENGHSTELTNDEVKSQSPIGSSGPMSDIDLSEDEDECRSREIYPTSEGKSSPSPLLPPSALSLPPYHSLSAFGHHAAVDRLPCALMPSPLLQQSMHMYMAQYMPQVTPFSSGMHGTGMPTEERRKRNRTFIDPVSEVPRLEQWFGLNTHPSHNLILKYTEDLNRMQYRQKFPKLEPKNIQFWFKNRRAKCKRLRVTL